MLTFVLTQLTTLVERFTTILQLAKKIEDKGVRLNYLKKVIFTGIKATLRIVRKLELSFYSSVIKQCYASNEIGWICQPPMDASNGMALDFHVQWHKLR